MMNMEEKARLDGKWELRTSTNLSAEKVALKVKELSQVEDAFRDMTSTFETMPVFRQRGTTVRGRVFCSFLALVLRKELARRLEVAGNTFEGADIEQALKSLQETIIEDAGKRLAVRSQCMGTCGKIFQSAGVAIPRTTREL